MLQAVCMEVPLDPLRIPRNDHLELAIDDFELDLDRFELTLDDDRALDFDLGLDFDLLLGFDRDRAGFWFELVLPLVKATG